MEQHTVLKGTIDTARHMWLDQIATKPAYSSFGQGFQVLKIFICRRAESSACTYGPAGSFLNVSSWVQHKLANATVCAN